MDTAKQMSPSFWSLLAYTRFGLASVVFASHLGVCFPIEGVTGFIHKLGGGCAVAGFLLISGISVAHSYEQKPHGFYRRRFLRIYPCYLFSLLITVVAMAILPRELNFPRVHEVNSFSWTTLIGHLFFFQDFFVPRLVVNGALWSLAVEVIWYAVTPVLKYYPKWFLYMVWGGLLYLFTWLPFLPMGDVSILTSWSWVNGYLLIRDKWSFPAVMITFCGYYGILINCFFPGDRNSLILYTWMILVLFCLRKTVLSPRLIAFGNYLGDLSYPLYVIHFPVIAVMYLTLGFHSVPEIVIGVAMMTLLTYYIADIGLKKIFISWMPAS